MKALLGRAFRKSPAPEANQVIDEVRGRWGRGGASFCYEIVLSEGREWSYLRDSVAPSLARYLRSKRMSVDNCTPVFLAIFSGDLLYFVSAEDFFGYFCEAEGCSIEALRERARAWENERQ